MSQVSTVRGPVEVAELGPKLQAAFPGGINVEWITVLTDDEGEFLDFRVWERGAGETLACGTGAVAAACALAEWGLAQPPLSFWTRSGRRLEVRARRVSADLYDDVWLGGEARLVVRGVIN